MILNGTLVTPSGVDPVYDGTISTLGANLIDDLTGDAMLDTMGITASVSELNYSGGVTSNIQTQLDTLTTSVNGKQAESDILTDLSGLSQAANKIPYFDTSTTASTLDFKDEDDFASDSATAIPSQQSVKVYADAIASTVLGVDQIWTDVSASRAANTSYQNTTGKPITVLIDDTGGGNSFQVSTDNSVWLTLYTYPSGTGNYERSPVTVIIPNLHYYKFTGAFIRWSELR